MIRNEFYDVNGKEVVVERFSNCKNKSYYDENGNIVLRRWFSKCGYQDEVWSYNYDGSLFSYFDERRNYKYYKTGNGDKKIFICNERDFITYKKTITISGEVTEEFLEYDEFGNIISYQNSSEPDKDFVSIYDGLNMIYRKFINSGIVEYFLYDENGNIVFEKRFGDPTGCQTKVQKFRNNRLMCQIIESDTYFCIKDSKKRYRLAKTGSGNVRMTFRYNKNRKRMRIMEGGNMIEKYSIPNIECFE